MTKYNPFNFGKDGVFSNIIFNAILYKILGVVTLFVSNIIISRGLNPEGRADFYLILTLINTIASFSYLGFPTSNIYFISLKKGSLETHFTHSLLLSFFGGIITLVYSFIITNSNLFTSIFSFFYAIISMLSLFLGGILISIQKEKVFFNGEIITPILMVIFYTTFWLFDFDYKVYLLGNLVSILVSVLFFFYHLKSIFQLKFNFNWKIFIEKLKFSLKVYITTVASFLISKGSLFLVAKYCSKNEVGNYSLAIQLVDAITLIPVTISTYLFPKLVRQELNSRWKMMIKILSLTIIMMLLIGLLIYLFSDQIILMVFGANYSQTSFILKFFVPGFILISLSSIISQYLASNNYPVMMVFIWLIVLVTAIIGSYYLTPKYGSLGNIISISISYAILVLLMLILSNNIRKKNVSSFS